MKRVVFIGYRKVVRIDAAGDSRHSQSGGESASAADGDRQDEFTQSGAGLRRASKGRLAAGMDADFIIIDEDYRVLKTFSERALCV